MSRFKLVCGLALTLAGVLYVQFGRKESVAAVAPPATATAPACG